MDLINALSGSTVQHAKTEEAVMSVYPTYVPIKLAGQQSCDVCSL
jgi:hypothetical protein